MESLLANPAVVVVVVSSAEQHGNGCDARIETAAVEDVAVAVAAVLRRTSRREITTAATPSSSWSWRGSMKLLVER